MQINKDTNKQKKPSWEVGLLRKAGQEKERNLLPVRELHSAPAEHQNSISLSMSN